MGRQESEVWLLSTASILQSKAHCHNASIRQLLKGTYATKNNMLKYMQADVYIKMDVME